MSMEELDTKPNFPDKELPDGTYSFNVAMVSKKSINGKTGYEWKLEYDGKEVQLLLWPSAMGPLLRVLGIEETGPHKFVFDTALLEGKKFTATAYKDKKGYQQLKDYKASEEKDEVPF